MITHSFLAQSFLTSILRVGVWIILAHFRLFSLMELSSALAGSDAILAWVSSDVIGRKRRHLGFVFERLSCLRFFALLGCSFARFVEMVVWSVGDRGVSVWEGRVDALLLYGSKFDLLVRFSVSD